MDWYFVLFAVFGFLAVVMLLEGVYLVWNAYQGPEARRIERRLVAMSSADDTAGMKLLKQRALSEVPALERFLLQLPRVHQLDRFLLQSGMNITVARFLGVALALWAVTTAAAALWGLSWLWSAAAGVAPIALWAGYVQYRRADRMRLIDQQLPDALDLMARAMQAGHAFSSALRMVGVEGPHPVADEFQTAFEEINFGVPTHQALANMSTRVASDDLRYFVVAVLIQREAGGNLAELLTSIANLIRERQRLRGTVRVLSAEGRLSAVILTLLPFVLAALIAYLNPPFMLQLRTDPIGFRMVIGALVLMAGGIFWMWRIIRIRI
jgi:tight adherence protein B